MTPPELVLLAERNEISTSSDALDGSGADGALRSGTAPSVGVFGGGDRDFFTVELKKKGPSLFFWRGRGHFDVIGDRIVFMKIFRKMLTECLYFLCR